MPRTRRLLSALAWLLPALAVAALYTQVRTHTYIDFDDPHYTYETPVIAQGLSWAGVKWAFTESYVANYHPLTWLSHMLDFTLFGNNPGAFALENAAWHAANSTLVALLFAYLFRSVRVGLVVGVVFATHPALVEAVAWISQRKTLLSTFFALISVLLFLGSSDPRWANRRWAYAGSLVAFVFSLFAKGMYVTMPVILPLLACVRDDVARRLDGSPDAGGGRAVFSLRMFRLLAPYAVLAAAVSVVTVIAQSKDGAVSNLEQTSLVSRLETALIGTSSYVRHFIAPLDLSAYYPREDWTGFQLGTAGLLLAVVTLGVIRARSWAGNASAAGWLTFLVMLLPVIGIVQVGDQASADRYLYGPVIGLLVVTVSLGLAARPLIHRRMVRMTIAGMLAAWMLGAAALGFRQISYWRHSTVLVSAALNSIGPHPQILALESAVLLRLGDFANARKFCQMALQLEPTHPTAIQNLAVAEFNLGNVDAAIQVGRQYVALYPRMTAGYANLALFYSKKGQLAEARAAIEAARRIGALTITEQKLLERVEKKIGEAP